MKLFNEKAADELLLVDINAARGKSVVDFAFVEEIVSEAFMPVSYGGGVTCYADAARLFDLGVEKVVINSAVIRNPMLVSEVANAFGSQAVVGALDVVTSRRGHYRLVHSGRRTAPWMSPATHARWLEGAGVGEILLTSVTREGTGVGFDLPLIRAVSESLSVPIVAHGGARTLTDLQDALGAGASAVAASAMFNSSGGTVPCSSTIRRMWKLTRVLSGDQEGVR